MDFENKNIEFLIESFKNQINFHESLEVELGFFNSLSEKHNFIIKSKFLLTMLKELEEISKNKDLYLYEMPSCLVFSCVEEDTLKSIGFKLFIRNKFGDWDLQKSDWDHIRKSIYKDIRENLHKKINALGHEDLLESHKKQLTALSGKLEKLQGEYKSYFFKSSEMEKKISGTQCNIEKINEIIPILEENILENTTLLEALSLVEDEFFDGVMGEIGIDREIGINKESGDSSELNGIERHNVNVIKIFCQIIFNDLFSQHEEEYLYSSGGIGEYSKQYFETLDTLQEVIFERLGKVVGYRLEKNIHDGDKNYPYVSVAVMSAFVDALDFQESLSGKKYCIKFGGDGQRIEISLELVFSGGDFQFKDLVARGIYGEILKRDRLGLENELVINKIKENYDNNKSCVENILKSMAKDFDVDFFSPNSMPILEGALSDFDEMFQSEKESIEFLLNGLKKEGYIVSKEYIVDFIFDQRLQNRTNALLEQIEGCVSDYLDTGLALPLIEKIFPESVPETERDAKVFLEEILKNTGKDRLRIALSGKISKKALIRAEEKINKLSEKDENISGVPRAQWVKIIIGHIFYYGEDLGIPDAVMIHVDIQNKRQLTEAFIEKLKFIYREEIKEYKEGFIKEIVSKLVVIPDKSLGLVAEWKNKIKSSIIELRPQERKFKKSFPKVLYSEVFSECTDIFIEKFDMKKAFIKPSYPINTKNIDEASNQAISQLSQALGMDENSPKYMLNYNALIKSYTQVLFEWECGEIKKLLKKAATDVDAINKGLTAKGLIESQLDFVLESAKTTLKAAMAAGGTSLLLGMKPQAMLCFSLLQAMNNSNPLIGISVFTLFYKYILPKILDEKTKYSLEKYEEAVFFAFNMSILPITEFLKNVQSVIQLKFPKNREKLSKMLISFVSALAGAVAFIYCPLIFSEILVAGVVNVSPLIFSYVVARFTFLVSTIFLGISYDDSFEEEIKILLLASLNVEYFQAAELAFLTIFKDFGKESHFLKSLGDFLSKIKNNSKDIQAEAIVHFFEARTLALLADLPLSASDEKLSVINDMMNHLKSLSATILTKVGKNFGNAEENKRDESVEQVLYDIETLLKDAPGRRAGRLRVN